MKKNIPPTVLLFDIDGTLVHIGGSGRRAMERTFYEICGSAKACPEISFGGLTDRGIIADGLTSVGVEVTEAKFQHFFSIYHDFLTEEVASATSGCALPGSLSLLRQLATYKTIALGLGTGNTRDGAFIKLKAAGLDHFFAFGGFGCDHADRTELIRMGSERGAKYLGISPTDARVVVIGDTPRDIMAAKGIGAESVGIATGEYSTTELSKSDPEAVFPNLRVPALLTTLLHANCAG